MLSATSAHSSSSASPALDLASIHRIRQTLVRQLRRVPALHRAAKEVWVGAKLVRLRLRQARRRADGAPRQDWQQSTLRFTTSLHAAHASALRADLLRRGLVVDEGRHTLYLRPQPGLADALGPVVNAFPPHCGFKILKRFAAPEHARYLYQADVSQEAALMGGIHRQALSGAALAHYGLGPKVYDVVHLRGLGTDLTVLVVEHVEGRAPTMSDYGRLIEGLDLLRSRRRMTMVNPGVYACSDFEAPNCNGNLLVTDEGLRYVDPQLFMFDIDAVTDDAVERHRDVLHFGDKLGVVEGGQGFLYQGLPGRAHVGRRDPADRWGHFEQLLSAHGVQLRDRVVFDVCCNAGLMMTGALRRGARWAVGWDLPDVAAAARELLPLIGAGRSTVIGRPLNDEADLPADLPAWLRTDEAVCLFLAAWHHVGFPPGVGRLPWRHLVYEGKEHEDASTTAANIEIMETRWGARALAQTVVSDGLCGPRPVVLLVREQAADAR